MSTFFSSFFLRFSRCDTYVRLDLFHHFSLRFLRKQKAGKEGERKGNLFTSLFYEGKKKNESKWCGVRFLFSKVVQCEKKPLAILQIGKNCALVDGVNSKLLPVHFL